MATAPPEKIVVGRLVQIKGLQVKPDYNGKLVVVVKYLPEKERWAVNLAQGNKHLSVKQEKMAQPEFLKKPRKKYLALEMWPTIASLDEVVSVDQIPVSPMIEKPWPSKWSEERTYLKRVKKWKNPSILGFSSKRADKPDLMMYFDVDDLTSPVNALANRIAAATPSYKHEEACTEAPKSAAGYRGNVIIVSSPTISEVESPSGVQSIVNAKFDTTFTMSRLQKELMFFKTEECIKKGKHQDTVGGRCFGGLPPDLIPQIPSSGHGYYIYSTVGKPVMVKKI